MTTKSCRIKQTPLGFSQNVGLICHSCKGYLKIGGILIILLTLSKVLQVQKYGEVLLNENFRRAFFYAINRDIIFNDNNFHTEVKLSSVVLNKFTFNEKGDYSSDSY